VSRFAYCPFANFPYIPFPKASSLPRAGRINTHPKINTPQVTLADPNAAFQARYRDGSRPEGAWNDVLGLQLAHRSVRAYLPDALPAGTLETLVAAAQSAASSSNLQL